jgi:NhaA family Na+:H+ antiporter
MTIFFLLVGLEIKREVLVGELATVKKAMLPVGAAIGGMLLPALIFTAFNHGRPTMAGWGIPMATDIAFALGALYLLGKRVPLGLRVFLSAFAIADDLGAVLVIALFYTQGIVLPALAAAAGIVLLLALMNAAWVRSALVYAVLGIALWLAVLFSGLHATVAGVLLALFIPARGMYDTDKFVKEVNRYLEDITCSKDGCGFTILLDEKHMNAVQSIEIACERVETPLQRMEHGLQPWVAFLIVPLFGLANAGFSLTDIGFTDAVSSPLTLGVATGLFLGKPVGITFFSWLFVKLGLATLPSGVTWPHVIAAGMLGGLGFTMALFIDGLSFTSPLLLDYAKLGILAGSLLSGIAGMTLLYRVISSRTAA